MESRKQSGFIVKQKMSSKGKDTSKLMKYPGYGLTDTKSDHHLTAENENKESMRHPVLVVVSGNLLDVGRILPIGRNKSSVGRDASTDLSLNDRLVSRRHIEIVDIKQNNGMFSILVKDIKSTNGTFINGKKITEAWIKLGESIEIGAETILLFRTETFTRIQDSDLTLSMISKDPLTGIYNRRAFDQLVEDAHEKAIGAHQNYCLIVLDLDYFKTINDSLGHPTGDIVLKAVARLLRNKIRAEDIVARMGGDEFAILLPNSTVSGASRLAERLLIAVRELRYENNEPMNVSLSIGISESNSDSQSPTEVYKQSDIALYYSKQQGRDRFTIFNDSVRNLSDIQKN
ncbi:GGDEF domain-containing protein [bacterium]|nr:GGDEF domain-containing protein [bacterium]